ncbi:Adenosine receptor A2b [Dufourea novaeangliae]|uniref:Adenosine receptor A2b n=1 Tax=Dufourea novaeangliae TaxID=178035 RepID=A0A154P3U2_DUFNO|nr:Adenosine receptor A2b [Dufourea novaeangliae]
MSTPATDPLPTTVSGELTTALIPTVTKIDTRLDVNPISVVLAVSIVCILSPVTLTGNSIILAAFYKYKRLRTASNYLLVSLAVSDFGVGVFMPFGMQLELYGPPENGVSTLCIIPYCIVIALCSVSVLVTVAIAVDRLTSLAQPLRYKNIITHSSIEKYIAVFWIYAIAVGLSPLIYAKAIGETEPHSGNCRFSAAVLPPVRVFLVVAVWAPSALVLLGCYMYVYLVARAHARAIYTVELSFRHQTQTLALPRYGQTLAVTVGAFLVLWLPFQTCMLLDIFCGTDILSEWAVVWLGLPIMAHSGVNPWIYAFHHGEMRIAAGKITEELVALFGVTPSRYGCSPIRRGSNTNLELAEVNNSNEGRRHPVEDCFAAKPTATLFAGRRGQDMSGMNTDISPERNTSSASRQVDVVEEDIHDLTKMLDLKYIIDRNHMIDSNHNIDKLKNLKYLLDPTFNKIRHMRQLNHKRLTSKNFAKPSEPKFTSYQNLKSDGTLNRKALQMNTMSDPVLSADSPTVHTKDSSDVSLRLPVSGHAIDTHRYSVQNLDHNRCDGGLAKHVMLSRQLENQRRFHIYPRPRMKIGNHFDRTSPNLNLRLQNSYTSPTTPENARPSLLESPRQKTSPKHMVITSNRLANLAHPDHATSRCLDPRTETTSRILQARRNMEILKHSESINTIEPMTHMRLLEPYRVMETLTVPTIHSEPPSPIDPLPLAPLEEESTKITEKLSPPMNIVHAKSPVANRRSPVRHSDPVIPSVLLNIEDYSEDRLSTDKSSRDISLSNIPSACLATSIEPIDLFEALMKNSERFREGRLPDPIFAEHDSTRFSSRRPSDSRWSESSRSQEVLSNVAEHQAFPSSYSVNNFQVCNSGSDLNDLTSLDPFMCPDALTSSLRESFFSAPSVPDSEIFTSFEENDESIRTPDSERDSSTYESASTMNPRRVGSVMDHQTRSTDSVFQDRCLSTRSCTILRLEPSLHRSRLRVRPGADYILKNASSKTSQRLAPLAIPTPTEICTPTFEFVSEIKGDNGVGVRV